MAVQMYASLTVSTRLTRNKSISKPLTTPCIEALTTRSASACCIIYLTAGTISQAIVVPRVVAVLIHIPTCWQLRGHSNPFRLSFGLVSSLDISILIEFLKCARLFSAKSFLSS